MSAKNSNANKKRGASAMLSSDVPSVDAVVGTVLDEVKADEVKADEVKADEDTDDSENVVDELMMATLYAPAVDKGVGGADEKKSVVMQEEEVVKALAHALEGSVMRLFEIADYEVHDGDFKTWFERGPFTSLKPDEMDEIAVCFARLAKIRRVQDAAVAGCL